MNRKIRIITKSREKLMNTIETIAADRLALDILWEGPNKKYLAGLRLGWAAVKKPTHQALSQTAKLLEEHLKRYVRGEEVEWPESALDFTALPPFAAHVLKTLQRTVKHGRVTTYGELARSVGRPGAARAVGGAMARNPWPLVVPCHRVVGAGGKLTGFSGAGLSMKRYLLDLEGIPYKD